MWNPQNPSVGDKVARAIVYFVALIYMFLGMSIIADRFMSSIEVGGIFLMSVSSDITAAYRCLIASLGAFFYSVTFSSPFQVITSQEKEITIKRPNGETTTATVRIWNETVSNLTLMALGSSAPEILLSVIEVSTMLLHIRLTTECNGNRVI